MSKRRTLRQIEIARSHCAALGERVRARRVFLCWTLDRLSELSGLSKGHLSQIENGNTMPTAPGVLALAKTLGCDVNYLLTGVGPGDEPVKSMRAPESVITDVWQALQAEKAKGP